MIDIAQLRILIIRPTLHYMNMWSEAAEDLVVGTAIQESRATYLKQMGNGPALGIFQMEPATHDDIWVNYINYRASLRVDLNYLTMKMSGAHSNTINQIPAQEMIGNLYYATAMCRLQYKRVPAALPSRDVGQLAAYWKQYYNTPLGAGTVDEFVHNFKKYNKYDT